MNQAYGEIKPVEGIHEVGLCQVLVAPTEWVNWEQEPLLYDFATGRVASEVIFYSVSSKFYTIAFIQETYVFDEKPKNSKGNDFYDILIGGKLNTFDEATRAVLETFRFHDLIVVAKDREGNMRLIGNESAGMRLSYSCEQKNAGGGSQEVSIDLQIQMEQTAPYYTP